MHFNINIQLDKTNVEKFRRDFRKGNYKEIRKTISTYRLECQNEKQDGNIMLEYFKRGAR